VFDGTYLICQIKKNINSSRWSCRLKNSLGTRYSVVSVSSCSVSMVMTSLRVPGTFKAVASHWLGTLRNLWFLEEIHRRRIIYKKKFIWCLLWIVVMVSKSTRDLDGCADMWGLPLMWNSSLWGWKVSGSFFQLSRYHQYHVIKG